MRTGWKKRSDVRAVTSRTAQGMSESNPQHKVFEEKSFVFGYLLEAEIHQDATTGTQLGMYGCLAVLPSAVLAFTLGDGIQGEEVLIIVEWNSTCSVSKWIQDIPSPAKGTHPTPCEYRRCRTRSGGRQGHSLE